MENPTYKRTIQELQRHISRTNNCKKTKTFVYRHKSLNKVEVKKCPHRCHSYFCESCANIKYMKLNKKLNTFIQNKHLRFLTLTLSTAFYNPETSIEKISKHFEIFVKLLRYRGYKFQYFKIIELTKNNIAHIHCLINCFLPVGLVSNLWMQITNSYIVNVKKIQNNILAVQYVLKYMCKSVNNSANTLFYMLKKRRYSYSQNFFLPSEKEPPFILTGYTYWEDEDFYKTLINYFQSKFQNYNLLEFIFLN